MSLLSFYLEENRDWLQVCQTHSHGIDMDYSVLKKASKEEGRDMMPSLIDRGKIADHFRFIIITLVLKRLRSEDKRDELFEMGHDMWRLRTELTEEGRFSLSTSLRLALLTLHPIEHLHSMGYIHRDIKVSFYSLSFFSFLSLLRHQTSFSLQMVVMCA